MNYKWILLGLGILLILLIIYKKRSSILGFLKPACPYAQSKKEEDFQPSIHPPDPEPPKKAEYVVLSVSKSPKENEEVPIGDIYISLYEEIVPKTCHNFKSLSKIEYKNCLFTALLKALCSKPVTMRIPMEQEAQVYTVRNSQMKILNSNTQGEDNLVWQIVVQIPTAPNFSLHSMLPLILMESTLFLEKSSKVGKYWTQLKP